MLNSISRFALILACLASLVCWQPARAGDAKSPGELAESFPGISEDDIHESPVPGLYELTLGPQVAYVSEDGRYLIKGEVIDLQGNVNLTEARRVDARHAILSGLDPQDMIVFSPADPASKRYTVTVFTDIDCGYCRSFHRNIQRITDLGIEVQYLMFPRSGPGSVAWQKAADVWCAEDRGAALTSAKNDKAFPSRKCDASQVTEQYELGQTLGLRGTPAVISERGDYLGGFLTPDLLLKQLEVAAASKPGSH